ncbi:MAG: rhodanese-like domain-containing protein, partial [Bacteroidales bacterium]|nr:rhodanese-like domain-containing protein [Bacteroidales bacterium]
MKAMSLFTALLGAMTCACGAPVTNLEIADFEAKAADPAVFLVDVRTPEEYAEGHLRGAANIDWNAPDFLEQVQAVCPKETPVAVYCRTGRRSGEASQKLSKAGYAVCN